MGSKDHELEEDAFVNALVPDPSNVPDAMFLTGFLGTSCRDECLRLYLTADLRRFVEIDRSDVLHAQSLRSEYNLLGGSAVWVNRTARLVHSDTTALDAQTEFLRGDMAAAFAAGAARGRGLRVGRPPFLGSIGDAGLAADPTLFNGNTCALSACVSNVAVCTNSGHTTCDPVFCS
jgi:hypothetical protein